MSEIKIDYEIEQKNDEKQKTRLQAYAERMKQTKEKEKQ